MRARCSVTSTNPVIYLLLLVAMLFGLEHTPLISRHVEYAVGGAFAVATVALTFARYWKR